MFLVFPLFIMLILIIIIVYWNYDKYSDLRKRFKGYRNIVPEPFEIKIHNFIIYGPSISGKRTFITDYSGLYETVDVFCIEGSEWKGYNVNGIDDLKLLDNLDSFANSLIIFDDVGENIRLPAIDLLYSKGRHHNINIICVGHTVTDLNTKARDNTPAIYFTLNSSQQFFEREHILNPTHIKPKKLMFYFEEYLEFKGIHKSINLYKIYTNIKNVLDEIHSGYIWYSYYGRIWLFFLSKTW